MQYVPASQFAHVDCPVVVVFAPSAQSNDFADPAAQNPPIGQISPVVESVGLEMVAPPYHIYPAAHG